jgi:hypothetical protein
MSLEDRVSELTAAISLLTEVISDSDSTPTAEKAEKAAPVKTKKAAEKKPVTKKKAPTKKKKSTGPTETEIRDILRQVHVKCGKPKAQELLTDYGVKKLAELEETEYAEFLEDAKEALEDAAGDEDDDEEEGEDEDEDEDDEDDDDI